VAIHKHAALPILISTAIIEAAVAEDVSVPAVPISATAALGKRRRGGDADYQSAKSDSQKIVSHRCSPLARNVGRVISSYLK
jgi:hypothetical protein